MSSRDIFFRWFLVGTILGMTATPMLLSGCMPSWFDSDLSDGVGGGHGLLVIDLPFEEGYRSQCTQGPGGSYSHQYNSTRYDVDFDTPNFVDDPVFSPVRGTAHVHNDPSAGFGRHIDIEIGGEFLLLGHLEAILVCFAAFFR